MRGKAAREKGKAHMAKAFGNLKNTVITCLAHLGATSNGTPLSHTKRLSSSKNADMP
jgi:hypothetical protein